MSFICFSRLSHTPLTLLVSPDCVCKPQVFRHLYVLAAQPRCVEAVDVDSHQLVYVPLDITLDPVASAAIYPHPKAGSDQADAPMADAMAHPSVTHLAGQRGVLQVCVSMCVVTGQVPSTS